MKWFRLYSEARNDAKLRHLADNEFRVWFNLLCFSSEQPKRGLIEIDNYFILAVEVADGDEALLRQTLEKLSALRITEGKDGVISFLNFAKRQYDNPSDRPENVRKRVTSISSKKKCNDNVTSCNDTDTDTDTDMIKIKILNIVVAFLRSDVARISKIKKSEPQKPKPKPRQRKFSGKIRSSIG